MTARNGAPGLMRLVQWHLSGSFPDDVGLAGLSAALGCGGTGTAVPGADILRETSSTNDK